MSRLQTEFQRLYRPLRPTTVETLGQGSVAVARAMVFELARPADWEQLSTVWRGVQRDLDLPAPAIAASGLDGLQLWFSLSEPVSLAQVQSFLDHLRRRYLPEVAARRIKLMPTVDNPLDDTTSVPALQAATGNWSTFVAPDLAPLFAETPWLDIPPGRDGQAHLLSALKSIQPAAFSTALAQLQADLQANEAAETAAAQPPEPPEPPHTAPAITTTATQPRDYGPNLAPQTFLLAVMNDPTAPLALRIEAAKALLPAENTATITA
ncbi:MAG: hypothetical protein AB3X41_01480 [Leptothrix ochracea]|uniref:hypothetical protein n=1 Tax=Leptothrix ochracea TaxID=735331 RepID=UPI0034E2BC2F